MVRKEHGVRKGEPKSSGKCAAPELALLPVQAQALPAPILYRLFKPIDRAAPPDQGREATIP